MLLQCCCFPALGKAPIAKKYLTHSDTRHFVLIVLPYFEEAAKIRVYLLFFMAFETVSAEEPPGSQHSSMGVQMWDLALGLRSVLQVCARIQQLPPVPSVCGVRTIS